MVRYAHAGWILDHYDAFLRQRDVFISTIGSLFYKIVHVLLVWIKIGFIGTLSKPRLKTCVMAASRLKRLICCYATLSPPPVFRTFMLGSKGFVVGFLADFGAHPLDIMLPFVYENFNQIYCIPHL